MHINFLQQPVGDDKLVKMNRQHTQELKLDTEITLLLVRSRFPVVVLLL